MPHAAVLTPMNWPAASIIIITATTGSWNLRVMKSHLKAAAAKRLFFLLHSSGCMFGCCTVELPPCCVALAANVTGEDYAPRSGRQHQRLDISRFGPLGSCEIKFVASRRAACLLCRSSYIEGGSVVPVSQNR